MKKLSRLTALLLALLMLLVAPVSALATTITIDDYNQAKENAEQANSQGGVPVEEESQSTVTVTSEGEAIQRETVEGAITEGAENSFTLPIAGKLVLSAGASADAYQWQILAQGVWASIVGENGASVTLTYAMLENALTGNTAVVRCCLGEGESARYTAEATVAVDETVVTTPVVEENEVAVTSYYGEAPVNTYRARLAALVDEGAVTYGAGDTHATYNVVINYLFEDNGIAADPYAANLAANSSFSTTVTFPTVQGYLPYLDEVQQNSLVLNFTAIDQDYTYNVVYKPTNVNYTVIHYQQNLNDDKYTEAERETKEGLTKSTVPEVAKTYEGFYALLYEKPAIAADGSTVVEIYYDRYYYLMNFDLDGGYGVEPIYARYGASIGDVGKPTKAGYSFQGWSLDGTSIVTLPGTMPAGNSTYKAVWQADNTAKVTVVFWGENADDEEYSYIKSATVNVKPGMEFTYSEDGSLVCGQEVHTHDASCGYACGQEKHVHDEDCYTLTCTQEVHTHSESCYTCGIENHIHDTGCYQGVGSASSAGLGAPSNPSNGYVAREAWSRNGKVIYINGTWYKYTGSTSTGKTAPTTCGKLEGTHTHTNECLGCGKTEHTHTDYTGSCYTLICTTPEHTHSDACGYNCGKTAHTHNSDCYVSGAGLDSNLWTFVRSDTVTVAADGSSVVNVYYDRTEKTLTFKYNYSNRNYQSTETITAKWGSDISKQYKAIAANARSTFWSAQTNGEGPYTNYFGVMPQTNATYYNRGTTGGNGTMSYWGQDLNGEYTVLLFEVPGVGGYYVTDEDRYEFQGFTYHHGTSNGSDCSGAEFYYTRNSYTLTFNDGYKDVKSESVKYEAPLSTYSSYVPDVPSAYEPNSVKFGGWYLNPECTGEEYKLDEHTMPADNVLLYAKWVPVTHTVRFYLDNAAMKAETELDTHPAITVTHGSKADPTPEDPENGSYTFVGWFYMEDGVEKAFDFANMPVNKDLKVYGKWSSNVLKQYTIYYKIQDTDTEIAAPTIGSGLAGITKTFEAKGGTDLYADYQEGYFPITKSHSMTLDINATEENDTNVYTFEYVQKDAVPYTVKYLNKETGLPVADEKTVSDNRKAVVTETFVPVSGMMPDAYQKRLVVSAEEGAVNEIIFYYTEDTTHAYYKITHYTENLGKDAQGNTTWTEYASSQAVGDIGTTYNADPMTIPGFTYDSTVAGTVASGELTASGLELKLYYKRNSYPYQVRYLEQGTGKQLKAPKDGTGKYGEIISESATDIPNYTAVAPTSKTLDIKIETTTDENDGLVATLNIITFYYTEKEVTINYVVVGPDGCGTVDLNDTDASTVPGTNVAETLKAVTGTAVGATATANTPTYKFVGWYRDANCTQAVDASWVANGKLTPQQPSREVTTGEGATPETVYDPWQSATYYAKFDYNLTTLTIQKSGMEDIDAGQSFLFKVTGEGLPADGLLIAINGNGSETISGLTVGAEYKVTEVSNWSWRYTASPKSIKLLATGNEVTMENTRNKTKWLDGDCYKENNFG